MRAYSGYVLTKTRGSQYALTVLRPEVEPAAWTLDAEERLDLETDRLNLGAELVREMKVRGRESALDVVGVPMLAFPEVALDDVRELRVIEKSVDRPVDEGRKA